MNFKNLFTLLTLIAVSGTAFSQIIAPSVVPASPQASALQKFVNYPVNFSTGLPDINVPVFTIQSDGFTVPIELKYHASGIRYDDVSKDVGIGWTLVAGGTITGTQKGIQDNSTNNFFKNLAYINPYDDGTTTSNDNHSLIDVSKGYKDSEYDVFDYSFLDYSGKFFYPGTTDPVLSPRRNFKITASSTSATGVVSKAPFTILDGDGISYKFGVNSSGGLVMDQPSGSTSTNASFPLTEIISADKSDTVRFTYTGVSEFGSFGDTKFKRLVIDNQITLKDQLNWIDRGVPTDDSPIPGGVLYNYQDYSYSRLDNISFKNGHVAFEYNSANQLITIKVYNNISTDPVREVTLVQSAFTTNTEYTKLDEVKIQNVGETRSYSYKFDYNGTPHARVSGIDYWGYYNGGSAPTSYVPNFSVYVDEGPTAVGPADRSPDETEMQKGILNKVTYPTGGYSVFTYEGHRYGSNQLAGGLRIKSIENFNADGVSQGQKWYKYGISESGMGTLYKNIDPADYCYTYLYTVADPNPYTSTFAYTYRERVYQAFPIFRNLVAGSSVTYPIVTEYTGDGTTANGKTIYSYSSAADDLHGTTINGSIPLVVLSNDWQSGVLLGKDVYKNNGSGGYTLISSLLNNYQILNYQTYENLKVLPYLDWQAPSSYSNTNGLSKDQIMEIFDSSTADPLNDLTHSGFVSPYSYENYYLSSGIQVLDNTIEVQDGVTRTTSYTYDGTYDKPRTVTTTESNGGNKIQQFTYSFDKVGTAPYTDMATTRNIVNPVIKQDDYKAASPSNILLQSTMTDWYDFGSNVVKPQLVSTSTSTGSPEPRLRYNLYDALGNIQTVSKENGPKTTYIWSYNGTYPVAKIENADFSTVQTVLGGSSAVTGFTNSNPSSSALALFLAALYTDSSLQNALITTYTYDPLVGMTSMKDPKGNVTTYEYDSFKRLSTVKDKDGNIVKAICYNYAGEATNCFYNPLNITCDEKTTDHSKKQVIISNRPDSFKYDMPGTNANHRVKQYHQQWRIL